MQALAQQVKLWGHALGFQQVGIADCDLSAASDHLRDWLARGYAGTMQWMAQHGDKRYTPEKLVPDTVRVISVRMDYLHDGDDLLAKLGSDGKAYISRYALGRDYHKLIRKKLAALCQQIADSSAAVTALRPFVDSAPVLEKPLAEKAGLGWIGKNTLLLNRDAGSWFFLGEIYTSLPLPIDAQPQANDCGKCKACLKICPTDAFPEPYVLDARRCISYLTIEHEGSIAEELRPLMGNRIYGCDDCQIVCPWNRFAQSSQEDDFKPRHNLDDADLVDLFNWNEQEFLDRTAGSPIRRIGYSRWLRNIAIGLGNAATSPEIVAALNGRTQSEDPVVREHVAWALAQHRQREGL